MENLWKGRKISVCLPWGWSISGKAVLKTAQSGQVVRFHYGKKAGSCHAGLCFDVRTSAAASPAASASRYVAIATKQQINASPTTALWPTLTSKHRGASASAVSDAAEAFSRVFSCARDPHVDFVLPVSEIRLESPRTPTEARFAFYLAQVSLPDGFSTAATASTCCRGKTPSNSTRKRS